MLTALCCRCCVRQVAAVYHGMLDEQLMQLLHRDQKTVVAWTVDEEDEMVRLLGLGVDGILTNAPARLKAVIQTAMSMCSTPDASDIEF